MKIIKWLLLSLLALLLTLAFYLAFIFDLNSLKAPLSGQVKKITGRELVIDGDIGWSVYPSIGLQLSKVSLSNLPDEALPPLLSIEQVAAGVELMPLLNKEIKVSELTLQGLHVEMVTLADGRTSLTGLGGKQTGQASHPAAGSAATTLADWQLAQVLVSDIVLNNDNRLAGVKQVLSLAKLKLADLEPGRAAPLYLELTADDGDLQLHTQAEAMLTVAADFSHFQIDQWQQQIKAQGSALGGKPMQLDLAWDGDINLGTQQFLFSNLKVQLDDFVLTGNAQGDLSGARPAFELNMAGNALDLEPWLPAKTAEHSSEPSNTPQEQTPPSEEQEPDLSAMRLIDFDADLSLDALKVQGMTLEQLALQVNLSNGLLSLNNIAAQAFGGQFTAKASIDARVSPAQYQFDKRIHNLSILQLLEGIAGVDQLSGQGRFALAGHGQGLTSQAISQLTATGELALEDGAVKGVNIAQILRNASAKLSGQTAEETEVKQTDFSNLRASLKIAEGKLITPELEMASPLLRVKGQGELEIASQHLDYDLTVALVGTLEGQGGKTLNELKDLPIPLAIRGPVAAPSVQLALDLDTLLKDKLGKEAERAREKLVEEAKKLEAEAKQKLQQEQQKLEQKAKDKLKEETQDLLNRLF